MDKRTRRLFDAIAESRLCYGEPVTHGDRTVIPVSRVSVKGGYGSGGGSQSGGGGGGQLDARPAGFIEIAADGSRFQPIGDPGRTERLLLAAAAVAGVLTLLRSRR
jgi:uncharacterized spore protein YtfJ